MSSGKVLNKNKNYVWTILLLIESLCLKVVHSFTFTLICYTLIKLYFYFIFICESHLIIQNRIRQAMRKSECNTRVKESRTKHFKLISQLLANKWEINFAIFIAVLANFVSLSAADTNTTNENENVNASNSSGPLNFNILNELRDEDLNCTLPSIDQFPQDLFTQEQRLNGYILLHLLAAVYLFYMIAIVCDEYFVPCIDVIQERLGLSPDVTAATFMAIATSSPELFTNVIGTFIIEGNIGVGAIVGSAVFNILAVGAFCGIFASNMKLHWYPITRDCLFYGVSIIALLIVLHDQFVTYYESLVLILLYFVYMIVIFKNSCIRSKTESFVSFLKTKLKKNDANGNYWICNSEKNNNNDLSSIKLCNGHGNGMEGEILIKYDNNVNERTKLLDNSFKKPKYNKYNATQEELIVNKNLINNLVNNIMFEPQVKDESLEGGGGGGIKEIVPENGKIKLKNGYKNSYTKNGTMILPLVNIIETNSIKKSELGEAAGTKSKSLIKSTFCSLLSVIKFPAKLVFILTIPNVKKNFFKNLYPVSFLLCILWIAFLTYLISFMITIIGFTFSIPDSVMGLTIIASGTSLPEALSSVIVAKQGKGDMALSNLFASNTFDLLICLGLPWLIRSLTVGAISINSIGIEYSTGMLFASLVIFFSIIVFNKFTMNKSFGLISMATYIVFIIFACLFEMNVFFEVNLPVC